MHFTCATAAAILAFIYAAPAIAAETTTCNGDTEPDWGDCNTLAQYFNDNGAVLFKEDPGLCIEPPAPSGVDGTSLNCIVQVCFNDPTTGATGLAIYNDYVALEAICDGDAMPDSGGSTTDPNYGITVSANVNPDYNPPSRKQRRTAGSEQLQRTHAKGGNALARRQGGICTDGSGTFEVYDTFQNAEKPGEMYAVTGRLPNGSMYTIQDSDSMSIGVSTSVTVESGFFDLFDASASVSVSGDFTVMTTTGVNVNVDCDAGQEGIVYLYPVYTEYFGECTSNNNAPITVYVPINTQNNYMVQCLGDGS